MHYTEENNRIKSDFITFFKEKGYVLEPSVALNSKIDPSVFLVGNCTNVFKQRLLNQNIGNSGHVLVQPAINSKKIPDFFSQEIKRFSSSYTSLGILHELKYLHDVITLQYEFFTQIVGLDSAKISISVNFNDKDFIDALKHYRNLNIITENESCRNKFGQCGDFLLTGRNIRFYYNGNNICVLSVYQNGKKDLAIESSSTIQVLLMEKYSLSNTMAVSVLNDFYQASNNYELKYYDCISTVAEMLHSGIRPNSSHMDGRILKKYIKIVIQTCNKMDKNLRNYSDLIAFYLNSTYPNHCMDIKSVVQEAFEKCR
ncbi:MAG: hypothetical protein IKP24_02470 [Alphaproteobacteria bacterium]|nr:hypothetical protein [Alphaproteobacteria bacterium]